MRTHRKIAIFLFMGFPLCGLYACDSTGIKKPPVIPEFNVDCSTGWFSFSRNGNHLIAVEGSRLFTSGDVSSLKVYLADIYPDTSLSGPQIFEGQSPRIYRDFKKISTIEHSIVALDNGVGFVDSGSNLRALLAADNELVDVDIYLTGKHSRFVRSAEAASEEVKTSVSRHTSRLVGNRYLLELFANEGRATFLDTRTLETKSIFLPSGYSSMFLFDAEGQTRLSYSYENEQSRRSGRRVTFDDRESWTPAPLAHSIYWPEHLFSVVTSYASEYLPRGDYVLRGQFDHQFDDAIVDFGKGVEELINIDARTSNDNKIGALGYSYENQTVYWVILENDEIPQVATSIDWLRSILESIIYSGGKAMHLISANEKNDNLHLLIGYEKNNTKHVVYISSLMPEEKLICKLSAPNTPHTSLLLDFTK